MANNTQLNQPTTSGDIIATLDVAGVKHELVVNEFSDGAGGVTKVSAATPMPITDAAAEASLVSIMAKIIAAPSTEAKQDALNALITTLNSIVATAAKQDTGNTSLSSIDGKLTTLNAKDFATQTTLASILAKIITAPATEAKQDTIIAALNNIDAGTAAALGQALMAASVPVVIASNQSAVPVSGTVTVDTSLLSTAAKQDSQITQETAINTVLGLIADAIVAAGATGSVSAKLRRATQGLEDLKTLIVLAAGTNIIGNVRIDQTTPGTTNAVQANAGTNLNTSALALEAGGNLAGIRTAVEIIDDWDETDRAKVNVIVGQAGIAAGTGVDGATVPRVTLATNVPLPAGTNAIGKLSANDGVDIGDTTINNAAGAAAVNVQDGGNSLTVDNAGTFATQVTSIIPGTGATNLGKAEDSLFADGDVGVFSLGVRQDIPTTDVTTVGDYQGIKTDAQGRLWVNSDSLGAMLNKHTELLSQILTELRIHTDFLAEGLNIKGNPDNYRNEPSVVNMF